MRLRMLLVVIGVMVLAGPPALASTFPDLPGMKAADRVVGGRAPSSLSTDSGAQTAKASAPASTSTDTAPVVKSANLPDTKTIREMPGAGVLPVFHTAARHAILPLGLVLLAFFVCLGWTKLLYALNRV